MDINTTIILAFCLVGLFGLACFYYYFFLAAKVKKDSVLPNVETPKAPEPQVYDAVSDMESLAEHPDFGIDITGEVFALSAITSIVAYKSYEEIKIRTASSYHRITGKEKIKAILTKIKAHADKQPRWP